MQIGLGLWLGTRQVGGFSPATLFAAGEPGGWYDPSDLSTMFQDSAGTTPVTATGQTVARINDKSGRGNHLTQATAASRPIYGIEPFGGRRNLLTFTEQFDNAAWVKTNATVSGDSTTAPDGTLTADTITLTGISVGAKQLASSSALARCYSFYVKNNSGARYFQILTDGTANAFANFDIQAEVVGSRGSSASASSITSVGNGWYRIQMTATDASATNIYIALVGSNTAGWSSGASSGSFYVWGAQLELGSTATAYQRVTDQWNVTQAGVPSVSYVQYDGTDDWFISPTITPGIDKAQVFAGVRKLADTNGVIAEVSLNGTSVNGAFVLQVWDVGRYGTGSRGTAAATAIPAVNTYTPPITNVLTGIGDIAADTAILRVNGVQAATSATDQGTGNYLAYPLYVGRRGGTSLPFNGRLYQLLVRFGANLDATTIAATEAFVNSRTGAYV